MDLEVVVDRFNKFAPVLAAVEGDDEHPFDVNEARLAVEMVTAIETPNDSIDERVLDAFADLATRYVEIRARADAIFEEFLATEREKLLQSHLTEEAADLLIQAVTKSRSRVVRPDLANHPPLPPQAPSGLLDELGPQAPRSGGARWGRVLRRAGWLGGAAVLSGVDALWMPAPFKDMSLVAAGPMMERAMQRNPPPLIGERGGIGGFG